MSNPLLCALDEAAALLGCTKSQVVKLGDRGELRIRRLGWRTVKVVRADVDRLCGVEPAPDPVTVATTIDTPAPSKAAKRRTRKARS